jgi:hypothetical protein
MAEQGNPRLVIALVSCGWKVEFVTSGFVLPALRTSSLGW